MNIAKITIASEAWQVELSEQNSQRFTGLPTENAKQLKNWLAEQEINGGVICTSAPCLLEGPNGTYELSQWLTETLNQPFVTTNSLTDFAVAAQELPWRLDYYGYRPGKDEYSVESLLTVGNGFMGLRGTTPEMEISDANYPATYLASLYDTGYSKIQDRTIANEDFVNAPNMQKIYLIVDGERIDIANNRVHSLKRSLNLRNGLLTSSSLIELKSGKKILLESEKAVSMARREFYGIRYRFQPIDFSGDIQVVTEADGEVYNYNVARYRSLEKNHVTILQTAAKDTATRLVATTKNSGITVVQEAQLSSTVLQQASCATECADHKISQSFTIAAKAGNCYELEKIVRVQQFRQAEQATAAEATQAPLALDFPNFASLLAESTSVWQDLWDKAAIRVEGDLMSQKLLNLHTYHMLVSASPNGNHELDASVTARGLHGEAYRGHIFWDELFILPFYILHFPETARQILLYRYHRLSAAKADAAKAGFKGAMFPWQSGLDGTEQSQELHLNPISGEWKEDHSRLQRHVSLAIAYNVWQYWHNTKDQDFMAQYGLEMMLEIAHFWQSLAYWDESQGRYSIAGVMGPDEFHEAYPNAEKGGLKDNAYTNMMVVWLFEELANLQQELSDELFTELLDKTGITQDELASMKEIRHQLALEINQEGIIAQFDGYFDLQDLDWAAYREKYGNIYRLDRILNAEGKSADSYKVAKQADSLMIYYNFSTAQVKKILTDLGYQAALPENYVADNLHYYLARTSHGSTLSRVVHAQLAAMVNENDLAWQLYQEALSSDYQDIQGGTTAEGIHAGVMAATLYIPLTTFAGMDIRGDVLHFAPNLPAQWQAISYRMSLRQIDFEITVNHEAILLQASQDTQVQIGETLVSLPAGETITCPY
ncbi:glycoside hydrolase family 65 protein [Enterococcus asini]|uniref:glycoside hydrolase family 65 protein n=1 Tax=Enterococcus asini TaxID=57732 RepID=UPI0022E2264C|nr:glycosyl hydrolase family 65 protein [Enterococcus asini]